MLLNNIYDAFTLSKTETDKKNGLHRTAEVTGNNTRFLLDSVPISLVSVSVHTLIIRVL